MTDENRNQTVNGGEAPEKKKPRGTRNSVRICVKSRQSGIDVDLFLPMLLMCGSDSEDGYVPPEIERQAGLVPDAPDAAPFDVPAPDDRDFDPSDHFFFRSEPDVDAAGTDTPAGGNPGAEASESDATETEFYTGAEITQLESRLIEGDSITPDRVVTLKYREQAQNGFDGETTYVIFRQSEPGLIHVKRTGRVGTDLTFRAHHRVISVYGPSFLQMELGIHTLEVDNRLLTDGVLRLDYIIELRGATAQRTRLEITVLRPDNA